MHEKVQGNALTINEETLAMDNDKENKTHKLVRNVNMHEKEKGETTHTKNEKMKKLLRTSSTSMQTFGLK